MKKTGMLLLMLLLSAGAYAQQTDASPSAGSGDGDTPQGTVPTTVSFPTERVQTPTYADLYCAGFVSKQLPNANFVAGGLQTPNTTKFVNGEMVYLSGGGYLAGQHTMLKAMGQPYAELARVRVIDARSKMAVAQIEFSCDPVNPGDNVVPYAEKTPVSFHPPLRFDRFAPATSKTTGRIVMARDFDSVLGTGMKVYMNVGSSKGVKVGDH